MAKRIKLPSLGENVEEATVLKVLVAEGDSVSDGQNILEMETDKATVEVPAESAGTIQKIHISEGDTVQTGNTIATIDVEGGEKKKRTKNDKTDGDKQKKKKTEKKEADKDEKKPSESSGSKATDTEESGSEEHEERLHGKEEEPEPAVEPGNPRAPVTGRVPVFAAPSIRQFAREIGVDIHAVAGSGPGGRISIDDVKRHARGSSGRGGSVGRSSAPLPDFSQWGETESEELSPVRRKTAEHLGHSWSQMPHVTLFQKADVTDLETHRGSHKEKVSLTAIIVKFAATALEAFPKLKASIDMANQRTIHKKYCHIGVAVDTPRGLVVPVIRDADQKNAIELSGELVRLAKKARDNKITMDDMSGGVFTVTNLGGFGTSYFTPIVNYPESAILGVGRAAAEAVYNTEKNQFVPRSMMPLSLSFDHRLIDGAEAARFLDWIVSAIEDPYQLAFEG